MQSFCAGDQVEDINFFNIPRLTAEEFARFSKLIYDESGIFLKENKVTLLSNRLRKRLKDLNLENYTAYLNFLASPENKSEIHDLLDVVSTNETYFFRNERQFEAFEEVLEKVAQDSSPTVRIWSAGCSTGEEPYTIAILVDQHKGSLARKKVEIIATDIANSVLEFAREGVYHGRRIEKVNPEYLKKYFTLIPGTDKYRVNDDLRKMIQFYNLNLFKDKYPEHLDIIFNRNVMIYFDKEHQKRLVEGFADVAKPNGYLFIGHAETLYNLTDRFTYQKIGQSPVYVKSR